MSAARLPRPGEPVPGAGGGAPHPIGSAAEAARDVPAPPEGLWRGDTGTLHELSRRAIVALLRGPYLSGRANGTLWAALIADEATIRSRLHELFLDLVIDRVDEFAFTRTVRTPDLDVPQTLRRERLTFADTAMLLVLRQLLLAASGERRVIVGQEEVFERLAVYRTGDESTYRRNLNAAWNHCLNRFRVLHDVGDDRVEISPVVRFLIDDDQVRALTDVYRALAAGPGAGADDEAPDGEAAGSAGDGPRGEPAPADEAADEAEPGAGGAPRRVGGGL